MIKKLSTLSTSALLLFSCSTTTVSQLGPQTYTKGNCSVTVYQTRTEAEKLGKITEACIVTGSSAFSFDHSPEGAIKNNIKGVCNCGASKAYIESRHTNSDIGFKGLSHVTLIGFNVK